MLSRDCSTCHLIVAQGPSENLAELSSSITGLEFVHPEEIDDAWKEMLCTDCHTPDQGY
jgi:ferredoxin